MNPEFQPQQQQQQQQEQQSPALNENKVVVLDSNTILESYPKHRRRQYQRRNSKVGRMFFESAATTTETSTCCSSLPSSESPNIGHASTTMTTTTVTAMNAEIPYDTTSENRGLKERSLSIKPLHSIIRPSKYGTPQANAALSLSLSLPTDVKTMRQNWGHVPQLSGSSMSSTETEEDDHKQSLSSTAYRGGEEVATTVCPFRLSSDFCYDPECHMCCDSRRIYIDE